MRVAIVGPIKAGKSTVMNALLRECAVPMGPVEKTFNVNEFKYGAIPGILVHFKNRNKPSEHLSYQRLAELTERGEGEFLRSIAYIEVTHPSAILKILRLIDTPGLWSYYDTDSRNTLERIGLDPEDLSRRTQEEATRADAVLYLFEQGISAQDHAVMNKFLGSAGQSVTPINAIGVFTKIDTLWPAIEEPLEKAREMAREFINDRRVRAVFYQVYPIAGQLALGAHTLTDEEFLHLIELARTPWERLNGYLKKSYERIACKEAPEVPLAPALRRALLERLDRYGVWLACRLIQQQSITEKAELTARLLEYTGFNELLNTVTRHFGNRSYLIKLGPILQTIKSECVRARALAERFADETLGKCEQIEADEAGLRELDVLRSYYHTTLALSEGEVEWLLQATGEYGHSLRQRLGLVADASIDTIATVAAERVSHWRRKEDNLLGSREERLAAATLARCYERIQYRARKAADLAMQLEELLHGETRPLNAQD